MAERFDAYYDSISCKSTGRHIHDDGEFVLASDYEARRAGWQYIRGAWYCSAHANERREK